jgi:hypothetical protein
VDVLFAKASEQWDRGKLRSAFHLFLSAAKRGDPSAQHDLGYFYDVGVGVKPNRGLAQTLALEGLRSRAATLGRDTAGGAYIAQFAMCARARIRRTAGAWFDGIKVMQVRTPHTCHTTTCMRHPATASRSTTNVPRPQ